MINKIFAGSRMSFTLCGVTAVLLVGFLPAVARDQCPESEPTEETPEAAIEPTPLPGYGNTLRATIAPLGSAIARIYIRSKELIFAKQFWRFISQQGTNPSHS